MTQTNDPAQQAAWDAARPRPTRRDKHGREELVVHPFLKTGMAKPRDVAAPATKPTKNDE